MESITENEMHLINCIVDYTFTLVRGWWKWRWISIRECVLNYSFTLYLEKQQREKLYDSLLADWDLFITLIKFLGSIFHQKWWKACGTFCHVAKFYCMDISEILIALYSFWLVRYKWYFLNWYKESNQYGWFANHGKYMNMCTCQCSVFTCILCICAISYMMCRDGPQWPSITQYLLQHPARRLGDATIPMVTVALPVKILSPMTTFILELQHRFLP